MRKAINWGKPFLRKAFFRGNPEKETQLMVLALTRKEDVNSLSCMWEEAAPCKDGVLVEWAEGLPVDREEFDGDPKKPYWDPFEREDLLNRDDFEWPESDLVYTTFIASIIISTGIFCDYFSTWHKFSSKKLWRRFGSSVVQNREKQQWLLCNFLWVQLEVCSSPLLGRFYVDSAA